jgi:hypothetical protein
MSLDSKAGYALHVEAAKAGSTDAMLEIARAWRPRDRSQDPWLSRAWLELAAAGQNGQALVELGWLYRDGWGVPHDSRKALTLFEKAASLGNAEAANEVAVAHHDGNGVPANRKLAFQWARKAAEGGSNLGKYSLAYLYASGSGVAKNPVLARQWLERAARNGHHLSKSELAVMLENGVGGPKDHERAARLYKEAADGDALSALRYAHALKNGYQSKPDPAAAAAWLLKAAQAGNEDAMEELALALMNGEGVARNARGSSMVRADRP